MPSGTANIISCLSRSTVARRSTQSCGGPWERSFARSQSKGHVAIEELTTIWLERRRWLQIGPFELFASSRPTTQQASHLQSCHDLTHAAYPSHHYSCATLNKQHH